MASEKHEIGLFVSMLLPEMRVPVKELNTQAELEIKQTRINNLEKLNEKLNQQLDKIAVEVKSDSDDKQKPKPSDTKVTVKIEKPRKLQPRTLQQLFY